MYFYLFSVYGILYTFGSNKYGQLGVGDFKRHPTICRVGGVLTGKRVENVTCGEGFTVVSTNGNEWQYYYASINRVLRYIEITLSIRPSQYYIISTSIG